MVNVKLNFMIIHFIKVGIEIIRNKDKVNIKLILFIIKVNLEKINLMVRDKLNLLMEILIKDNLLIIYLMVKGFINIIMEMFIMVSGRKDSNMGLVNLNINHLVIFMMGIGLMIKKKVMGGMNIKKVICILVNLKMI